MGLPSVINRVLFYTLMILIPVVFFAPVLYRWRHGWHGQAVLGRGEDCELSSDIKLWHRMLCVLLSYLFLVGPEAFHYFAQADVQYSQLTTAAWGNAGDTITYGYDDNGSMISKVTNNGSSDTESVTYRYNLQNRLSRVITDSDPANSNNHDVSVVDYSYNTAGIRISKCSFTVVQTYLDTTDEQTYATDITTTDYLVDPYNHTGYAQVLQETTDDGVIVTTTYYTIGDDVLAQTVDGTTEYLLYDGYGSTRQLVDNTGAVVAGQQYNYDAYGVMLGDSTTPYPAQSAATSLLYAGEQYDANMDQYYLRARYYNQNNGTFNRIDPYAGNMQDPQSLHKYAYVYNNPVNNIDPSGMFSLVEVSLTQKIIAVAIGALAPAIIAGYESAKAGLGWGQIIANSAIAWALAFGFGVAMIFIGPAVCKAIITALTKIPGVTVGMAKTALMVVGYGLLAYGMLGLWTSDYPLAVKISVTVVIALSIATAMYKTGKTGGRLGNQSTRDQNKQIARELKKRRFKITGGGGELPEEYLRGPNGGTKGSNYVDITAKHKDTGRIIRINTVDTRADGFTPTTREARAAASIRAKIPEGDHLILIPKKGG